MSLYSGEGIIYFDNASTSYPKPVNVAKEITDYLEFIGVSPGRGGCHLSQRANQLIENVRWRIATLIGAKNSDHIIFTHNATHAINIVLKGFLKPGDHVIISNFEHNAVYRPLNKLKSEQNIFYDIWESDIKGNFDLQDLKNLIKPNTKLVVVNHASNVIGVLSPIIEIGNLLKETKISFLVDIAQTAGLFPVAFADYADYIVGTGHKSLLGPPGVGFLYVRDESTLSTLYEGGSGEFSKSPYHPEVLPLKFEAGTCNYLGIAGLKGSFDYIEQYDQKRMNKEVLKYTEKALDMLHDVPDIIIYGTTDITKKVNLISFNLIGYFANEVAYFLKDFYICVRSGLQCAPLIHNTIKTIPNGTIRISFGHRNTEIELEILHEKLIKIQKNRKGG